MDVLSEVLRVVKMESAFFFNAEFTQPWCLRSPASCKYAEHISSNDRGHIIIYHLLIEGHAAARLGNTRIPLTAGDIVIFPHGAEHFLENGKAPEINAERELPRIFAEGLKLSKMGGGGGDVTKFVCGFMVCESKLSQVFLAGLPEVFKVNIREDQSGQWLENSIRYAIAAASATGDGGNAVVAKLCETLFIETLRRYVVQLPDRQAGWLAGARAVLAERFRHYLGEPPVAYLTRWRLQLGAQMLSTTSYSVAQIAAEVGYDSEQAFNRAFKRQFQHPPARYRGITKAAGARAS
jgi:hypothetical protein